jgi:hypothetical protein
MRKYLLIVVFAFSSHGCMLPIPHQNWITAQQEGIVLDYESKEPMKNAKIEFLPYENAFSLSGEDGRFTIEPIVQLKFISVICPGPCDTISGNGTLRVKYPGYKTMEIQINGCIGHPDSPCKDRSEFHEILMEKERI